MFRSGDYWQQSYLVRDDSTSGTSASPQVVMSACNRPSLPQDRRFGNGLDGLRRTAAWAACKLEKHRRNAAFPIACPRTASSVLSTSVSWRCRCLLGSCVLTLYVLGTSLVGVAG